MGVVVINLFDMIYHCEPCHLHKHTNVNCIVTFVFTWRSTPSHTTESCGLLIFTCIIQVFTPLNSVVSDMRVVSYLGYFAVCRSYAPMNKCVRKRCV